MDKPKYTTLHFSIDFGEAPGVFCSYCGKRITPEKNLDTEELIFTCDCDAAVVESDLIRKQKEILEKIKNLYNATENDRVIILKEKSAQAHAAEAERLKKEVQSFKDELEEKS